MAVPSGQCIRGCVATHSLSAPVACRCGPQASEGTANPRLAAAAEYTSGGVKLERMSGSAVDLRHRRPAKVADLARRHARFVRGSDGYGWRSRQTYAVANPLNRQISRISDGWWRTRREIHTREVPGSIP